MTLHPPPDPIQPQPPDDLPEHPDVTYNPGRSVFGAAFPSSFPTYRAGRGQATESASISGSWMEDVLDTASTPESSPLSDLHLKETLATGGFGEVWLGEQSSLQRTVAVKRLRHDQLLGATDDQRQAMRHLFRHEALTTARLEHPNIVPVYQLLADRQGNPLLSMKWVKGRAWHEQLRDEQDLPSGDFLARHLAVLIDVAQAVAFAHSQGILHRDIKPHQVMVGEFGEVMLMDWGLAMAFSGPVTGDGDGGDLPSGGELPEGSLPGPAGTPSFMAPEQALGEVDRIGPWTDLYLLGGVLYFLLTGTAPHLAPTSMAALLKAAKGEVTPPGERAEGRHQPPELVELAMGTLQADPAQRKPKTVTGFIESLQAYLSGASKRQRARDLLQEITAQEPADGYVQLERQLGRLRQAEALWPELPELRETRDGISQAYVESALDQGDLRLAHVQAEQLTDGDVRGGLLERIDQAIRQRRDETRQRRWALSGLMVVLLLLVAGGFKYVWDQQRANERLLAERDAARQARAESESLMSFMLEDLWDGLSQIDRVDILLPVAGRAETYYAQRDVDDLGPEERLNLGLAMGHLSTVLAATGQFGEAIETQQRSNDVLMSLERHPDLAREAHRHRLEGQLVLGNQLRDHGETDAAEDLLRTLLDELGSLQASQPSDLDLQILFANAEDSLGILHYDLGRLEDAKAAFEAAHRLWSDLRQRHPEEGLDQNTADVQFRIAVTLMDLGQLESALEHLEVATAELREALKDEDGRRGAQIQLGFFESVRVELLRRLGRLDIARRSARAVLPNLYARLEEDTQDIDLRYNLALLELALGRGEEDAGNGVEARRAWRRGVDVIEAVKSETDHGYLLDTYVRLLLELGETEDATPILEQLCAKGWHHQNFHALCEQEGSL